MNVLKALAVAVALTSTISLGATIPPGASVRVRTIGTISSKTAHSGDSWTGTIASNISSGGHVIAHRGDPVKGLVTEVQSSGRLSKPGSLTLTLTSVNGRKVTASPYVLNGSSHKKRNIGSIGGGSALGAIIGGIAGGGKGAAIGAGAGAGAGAAGAAATGKKDVEIPAETILAFTVQ